MHTKHNDSLIPFYSILLNSLFCFLRKCTIRYFFHRMISRYYFEIYPKPIRIIAELDSEYFVFTPKIKRKVKITLKSFLQMNTNNSKRLKKEL